MTHPRMSKVPEWPRPHNYFGSFGMGLDTAVANEHTLIPLITYDEGLGAINSYKSCPQNAGFAEYSGAKCYPTSRINNIFAKFTFQLSKEAIETDKVQHLQFWTSIIHTAFNEGAQALDEISTLDLNEICELQSETTDRQTFPLYNAIDMKDGKSNAYLDLEVGQEGLDTDLEIEGIAFQRNKWYDCLHYFTNGDKLRAIATPLKMHTLTRHHTHEDVYVSQQSNTKYMNPYAGLFLLVSMPKTAFNGQLGKATDTTDVLHMQCDYSYRYNEHNHEFDHSLQ